MINLTKNERANLRKAIKNFNAKRNRVISKGDTNAQYQPNKASMKEALSDIKTKTDYNNVMRSLKRYTEKGVEKTVNVGKNKDIVITRYQLKELRLANDRINRAKIREHKSIKIDTTTGTMNTISQNATKPFIFKISKMTQADFEKFTERIKNQDDVNYWEDYHKRYKENYLKALEEYIQFDTAKQLYDYLEKIDYKVFYKISLIDENTALPYVYGKEDGSTKFSKILDVWQNKLKDV